MASGLTSKLTSLLEVPSIVGSARGGLPLLGYLMNDLRSQNAGAIQALNNYVTPPPPRQHKSGGGGGLGGAIDDATSWVWKAAKTAAPYALTAAEIGGGIALTVGTDGAALPAFLRAIPYGVRATAGVGMAGGVATTAGVEALRHQPFDPGAASLNGALGFGTTFIPGAGAWRLLSETAPLRAVIATQAAISIPTGAGASATSQALLDHHVSPGLVGLSTGASLFGSLFPGVNLVPESAVPGPLANLTTKNLLETASPAAARAGTVGTAAPGSLLYPLPPALVDRGPTPALPAPAACPP